MMPAVMMTPVVVVAPVEVAADAARAIIGHDDAAAGVRIIGIIVVGVIVVRVIVKVASGEEAPVVPVAKPMTAMAETAGANATAIEHGARAERTAMNGRAAATPTVSAPVPTTAMPASAAAMPTTATATATADFRRQPVGGDFGCGQGTWIDQRYRLRTLAGDT